MLTTRFSLWCSWALYVSSRVSGFATTSTWGIKHHRVNRDQFRYHGLHLLASSGQRYRHHGFRRHECDPAASRTGTRLHLSFSAEFPVASEMISTYAHCLKYHYFPTQSVTNAILTVVGDGLAQTHEASQTNACGTNDNNLDSRFDIDGNSKYCYDPKRGMVYFFKGLGSGVMWAYWFDTAEVWSMDLTRSVLTYGSSFQQSQEMTDFATAAGVQTGSMANEFLSAQGQTIRTAINIFLEQFLVCPVLFSLWDIPVTSLLRGSPPGQVPAQIRQKLLPLLVANAKVWTLVNIVTYNIPLEYRLLFTSAASIVSEMINAGITSEQITTPERPNIPITVANPQPSSGFVNSIVHIGTEAASVPSAAAAVPAVFSLGSSGALNGKNVTLLEL